MHTARKARVLLSGKGVLLVQAVLLLGCIRLGLSLLPFRWVEGLVNRLAPAPPEPEVRSFQNLPWIVWAITRGSRLVPGATCLTQALAAQVLLNRRLIPATVHIGVRQDPRQGFKAHAWVSCGGAVVLGGDVQPFTPMARLGGPSK